MSAPDTCPRCGRPFRALIPSVGIQFECATIALPVSGHAEGLPCVMRQRDQLAAELQTLRTANAALVERVHAAEAVLTDPHALWANWLRGAVRLPSGIGDIRECSEKMKRFRSRWIAAHHELRKAEDSIERAEERVKRLEEVGDKMSAHIDGEARLWGLESSEFGDEWREAKG